MKIGFLVPSMFAVGNPANGVAAQARFQAEALEALGHEVVRLNPWEWQDPAEFDVVQFFIGGFGLYTVENLRRAMSKGILAFAPIIDSNEPNVLYRMAAAAGNLHPKIFSIPGELRRQALRSDVVICRSTFERNRVIKGLGISAGKVEVVLNGTEVKDSGQRHAEEVRSRLELTEDYVLHVSAYTQQRKNVVRLAEAVGPLGYPLVIAGFAQPGRELESLQALARKFRTIRLLGFLDRDSLHGLYAGCRVFCLPSRHEGTGLVALEAAAHGANVVITRNGGPPDYFGPHAEYVDPDNTGQIREAVRVAWEKPKNVQFREFLSANLTWKRSAEALVEVYGKCLERKRNAAS
jgi:glycosyltransferase involved in cell wall biosynthesis